VPPIEQRFVLDGLYTKADIYRLCEIPLNKQGGSWNTGYARWKGAWFIFCNIGVAGRTGHDYANRFVGDELVWFGKTGARAAQPSVAEMLNPGTVVLVFYREADRDPFTFHGRVRAVGYQDSDPVCIRWAFFGSGTDRPEVLAQEVTHSGQTYAEGAVKQVTINAYERNPQARNACIRAHGIACVICAFNFERDYGDIGVNYIHVHHLRPISQIGGTYTLNPVDDLRPVCPNCHAMLHRRNPPYSVEELIERRRLVAETAIGVATYSDPCKRLLIQNE
jgi:5-methylcytosine-specific restriction protein A